MPFLSVGSKKENEAGGVSLTLQPACGSLS
jgi:hypothetical protein